MIGKIWFGLNVTSPVVVGITVCVLSTSMLNLRQLLLFFLVLLSLYSRVSLVMVGSFESKPLGYVKHILQAFLLPSKQHHSIEGMKGGFCGTKVLLPACPC